MKAKQALPITFTCLQLWLLLAMLKWCATTFFPCSYWTYVFNGTEIHKSWWAPHAIVDLVKYRFLTLTGALRKLPIFSSLSFKFQTRPTCKTCKTRSVFYKLLFKNKRCSLILSIYFVSQTMRCCKKHVPIVWEGFLCLWHYYRT